MAEEIAISVQSVSKAYRIWDTPAGRLTAPVLEKFAQIWPSDSLPAKALLTRAAKNYRDFWALRDVSFELKRGESLGIIGRNGSGKSTLLQIIAGTLQPTSGQVHVNGRIAALLELGSGFNPEFTGRENVYLNGAILGLTEEMVRDRFEQIADFAEIGDFIDQPVKTYSSGMMVRLAFALAAHVDADILIIDEALAVGDARFQLKCARRIDRFIEEGRTLLFVSHDASSVKRLCKHATLLNQGRQLYLGLPNDVVNLYSKLIADGGSEETVAPDIAALNEKAPSQSAPPPNANSPRNEPAFYQRSGASKPSELVELRTRLRACEIALASHPRSAELAKQIETLLADERKHLQISGQEFSYGGELGRIHSVEVLDANGELRSWFQSAELIQVRMLVEAFGDYPDPIFALTIKNTAGVDIYGTNTLASNQPAPAMKEGERREVVFRFNLNLMPGSYFLSFGFTHWVGDELLVLHRRYDALKIDVHRRDHTFGIANLNAVIESSPQALTQPIAPS